MFKKTNSVKKNFLKFRIDNLQNLRYNRLNYDYEKYCSSSSRST